MSNQSLFVKKEKELSVNLFEHLPFLYNERKMTIQEIANTVGVSKTCARGWLLQTGVTFRDGSDSKKVQYSKMSVSRKKEQTHNATTKVNEMREAGTLNLDYSHLIGDKNPAKRPEVRKKISEALKKLDNHNTVSDESLKKMRVSMEEVLRRRATKHELLFKNSLAKLGYFPKFQHAECTSILDFAFVDLKIGIELDGIPHMTFPKKREKDVKQDAELESGGWIILRFFNCEIENHLGECLREVIELVEENRRLLKEAI